MTDLDPDGWLAAFFAFLEHHPALIGVTIAGIAYSEALVGLGLMVSSLILVGLSSALVAAGLADLRTLVPMAFLGALLGDHTSFALGRLVGERLRHARFMQRRAALLERAEDTVRRYGPWSIVLGRLLPPIRSVVPFAAGVGGLPVARFAGADFAACMLWAGALALIVAGVGNLI